MKALLFGAGGQLGRAVLSAASIRGLDIQPVPRSVDVADVAAVDEVVRAESPQWVLNAAAMTDVDGAHRDPRRAVDVNGVGPGNIARSSIGVGARVVQISTEAVFDGERTAAYREDDTTNPVSVYGAAKRLGESLTLTYSPESYVLRTSWLYSGEPGANFPTRMLEQFADPDRAIAVVTDIIGNPTPTSVLADAMVALIQAPPEPGTYHVCCTGAASKHDWAVEIARSAGYDASRIREVTSSDYPTVALRPKHVDLDCTKFVATGLCDLPTWQDAWAQVLAGLSRR